MQLMKEVFAPALRRAGLKGSAGRFELPSRSHWALVGFQRSAYNDVGGVRFTVNLSAIDRDAWAAAATERPYLGRRPAPNTFYGSWADQTRIGSLRPDGQDHWWHLTPEVDPGAVGADVLADLERHAVPWLKERTTG